MPGNQAARYLRTKCTEMRILLVGGMLDDERLADRETLAGFDVFPKPYSAREFLDKVRDVLDKPRG